MRRLMVAVILFVSLGGRLSAADPTPKSIDSDLDEAKRIGWQTTLAVVETLEAGDQKDYPGIQAWLKDFRKAAKGIDLKTAPDRWPALDTDALITRNPNFWQAYYEIAPGDPALALLHAGLLLASGEATRASHLLAVAAQRPGVPKELRQAFEIVLMHTQKAAKKSNALVYEGIKFHDKREYEEALKKYREALAVWPQNGFAHYEVGYTLREQKRSAAGEQPNPQNTVIVNNGKKNPPEVDAAFAKARKHDPFQINAYQGDNQEVIGGFMVLVKNGLPAWQTLAKNWQRSADDEVLQRLAAATQEAGIHDLALATRQVLVARRGGYAPADHPFITTSLRKLAPGMQTEDVLKRLGGKEQLQLRQLVAPEPDKP